MSSSNSTNRRIFSAAAIIAGSTLAVALATVVQELLVAASFGTNDALDAFLIALLLPTFVITVIAGSFNAALVPTYIQVREREGQAAAQRVFSGTVVISIGLLVVMMALLALAGPFLVPILGSGFRPEKLLLTQRLFYLLLPTIAISGLAKIWGLVLNAEERFALAALAPIIVPLTAVTTLLIMGATWGIYALTFGTIAGFVLQMYLLGWALRKQGVRLWPRWHGFDPAMRQVIGQYVPMVTGVALLGSTLLVDQAMAATLDPGSVATLSYGNKVVTLVTGLSTAALGTAVLPYFSKLVAVGDWAGVRHTLKTYSGFILLATIPLTVVLYAFSELIVQLLFQRGAFTEADTFLVAQVQAMYVLQVPFFALGILFVRLISSLRANHILMWSAVISFLATIVLDYILMRILGVAGIALATTLIYIIALCFLSIMLYRMLNNLPGRQVHKERKS